MKVTKCSFSNKQRNIRACIIKPFSERPHSKDSYPPINIKNESDSINEDFQTAEFPGILKGNSISDKKRSNSSKPNNSHIYKENLLINSEDSKLNPSNKSLDRPNVRSFIGTANSASTANLNSKPISLPPPIKSYIPKPVLTITGKNQEFKQIIQNTGGSSSRPVSSRPANKLLPPKYPVKKPTLGLEKNANIIKNQEKPHSVHSARNSNAKNIAPYKSHKIIPECKKTELPLLNPLHNSDQIITVFF